MDGEKTTKLLEQVSQQVETRWEQCGDDRKMYLQGVCRLQEGKIEEASRVFRRAARYCTAPFATMARMAQARCEVVRGRQGAALRIFRNVATSDAPETLRQMAWREVADLACEREDPELLKKARDAISAGGTHRKI